MERRPTWSGFQILQSCKSGCFFWCLKLQLSHLICQAASCYMFLSGTCDVTSCDVMWFGSHVCSNWLCGQCLVVMSSFPTPCELCSMLLHRFLLSPPYPHFLPTPFLYYTNPCHESLLLCNSGFEGMGGRGRVPMPCIS